MLFSEIYGSYFRVVAAILTEASAGGLTGSRMTELVREKAFAESALSIPAALQDGTWPLLDREMQTVLTFRPSMPLTTLEKRWLKATFQTTTDVSFNISRICRPSPMSSRHTSST